MTNIQGHDASINAFMAAMRGTRSHHGWLFAGPEGIGKASLAKTTARRLLAEAADPKLGFDTIELSPAHPTAALIDAWSHPDFILVDRLPKDPKVADKPRIEWAENEELRRSIRVDQVRDLNRRFATHPTFSSRRIVIIDGAEYLEVEASNALLKMLEEPPLGTVFILVTHTPGRLLPTIRSRCRALRFHGLNDDSMTSVLQAKLRDASPEEIETLRALGQGSPGRALKLAGVDVSGMTAALQRIATTGDPDNRDRAILSSSMASKSAQARFEAFLGLVPAFLASEAKTGSERVLRPILEAWEEAQDLASYAVPGSLDPQAVTFALASHVATLAPQGGAVKA
jgi:DNA polymerase III subunit delta'